MQDIQPRRLFASASGSGDRRFKPNTRTHHHHNQALKCPRCDSHNTKFCYYNNYNLSQPRHFCKSCRRYWTSGGLLRNVPVGGSSRKSNKRTPFKTTTPPPPPPPSLPPPGSNEPKMGLNEPGLGVQPTSQDIGSFGYVVTSSIESNNVVVYNQDKEFQTTWNHVNSFKELDDWSIVENGKGLGPLDWEGINGLFDLPLINGGDQAYWSQPQWSTTDPDHPSLPLP